MAYVDTKTPVIEEITLPSGNTYYIADREIRDVVADLVEGGVNFSIAWSQANYSSSTAPAASVLAAVPKDVTVYYDNGSLSATGTLVPSASTKGAFVLLYSKTPAGDRDYYDEYVTVNVGTAANPSYVWEKIGDTIIDFTDVVRSIQAGSFAPETPDDNGMVNITNNINTMISEALSDQIADVLVMAPTGESNEYVLCSFTGFGNDPVPLSYSAITAVLMSGKKCLIFKQGSTQTTFELYEITKSIMVPNGSAAFVYSLTVCRCDSSRTIKECLFVKSENDDYLYGTLTETSMGSNATLNKVTDSVIGADATFTITQPTISLATDSTSGTGKVQVATGISGASASGDNVTALTGLGSPSTATVLTGVKVTAQPSVSLTANAATSAGRVTYVESVGTAPTTKLSASASGGAVTASGDNVTALTGLGSPSTKSAIGANSTFTITQPTVALSSNASSATGRVQVATGGSTASTTNTDWLKGVSVSNGVLTIGAATQGTTYLGATASGANTAWNSKDAVTAVTGYSNPTTDTVLGTASAFNVTDPTVSLSSGNSGDVTVATGNGTITTKYLSASASGAAVGADGTATAVTGYSNPTTDTVLGTGSTITVTPSTTYIKGTASGANTAWNNKDTVAVLTSNTSITNS